MNVDLMRKIDYFVGVPLCFLGTLIRKLIPGKARPPENVLLIELSEMGSAILVDPAMQKLKSELGVELHFVIFEQNAASLRILGTVAPDRIFKIRADGLFSLVIDTLRFLVWTRRRQIDTVIDLELFSRYTALLTGFCGASNRVGFYAFHNEGLYRGELLTHRVAYNPHVHISKNFISLVHALQTQQQETPYSKIAIDDSQITLRRRATSETEKQHAREVVYTHLSEGATRGPFVLVNANAGDLLPHRRWEYGNYAALIGRILEHRKDATVLLTGSPSEREGVDQLRARVEHPRCVNMAGAFKLEEMPALYEISGLMVTNDSGAAHFASVTPLPTFILYGPETPELYGSLGNATFIYAGLACSPCVSAWNHRKTACTDNVCMQAITPEIVFERIRPTLDALAAHDQSP